MNIIKCNIIYFLECLTTNIAGGERKMFHTCSRTEKNMQALLILKQRSYFNGSLFLLLVISLILAFRCQGRKKIINIVRTRCSLNVF